MQALFAARYKRRSQLLNLSSFYGEHCKFKKKKNWQVLLLCAIGSVQGLFYKNVVFGVPLQGSIFGSYFISF